jgi:UPF0716 protein FxsA
VLRLLLLLLPILEIAGFILVGGAIGLWPTLGLVVLAGLAGTLLLRGGGVATALALRHARGRDAEAALLRGGFRLLAGVLLLVPGFLTDLGAIALLLPPVQALALARLRRAAGRAGAAFGSGVGPTSPSDLGRAAGRGTVIDAEWIEVEPGPLAPGGRREDEGSTGRSSRPPSGWTRP